MERYICYEGKDHTGECRKPCAGCASYGKDRRQLDRRRSSVSLRLRERRDGFDRRHRHLKRRGLYHWIFRHGALHLRDNTGALIALLILFAALNVADFAFTMKALAAGFVEGNPVMDAFFSVSPLAAGAFKIGVASFIMALIWLFKRYRAVLQVSIFFLLVYMLLIAYHIYGAIRYY